MRHTWLTVPQVCEALSISEHTWKKWRAAGKGPQVRRLPNGSLRIRSDWADEWMDQLLDLGGAA